MKRVREREWARGLQSKMRDSDDTRFWNCAACHSVVGISYRLLFGPPRDSWYEVKDNIQKHSQRQDRFFSVFREKEVSQISGLWSWLQANKKATRHMKQ